MISTPQIMVKKCTAKPIAFESPPHAPYKAARPIVLTPMGSPVGLLGRVERGGRVGRGGRGGRVGRVGRGGRGGRVEHVPPQAVQTAQAAQDTDHVSKKLKFDEDHVAHAEDSMVFTIEDLV